MTERLLIATHNQGKVREYRELLGDLPLAVTYLDEVGISEDIAETEDSFAGNALLKARHYAEVSGLWTWADDSGLEVDPLGGAPGVYSARYAGPDATDRDRYEKLLAALHGHPRPWPARFQCVVALARPNGKARTCAGTLEGVITAVPRGSQGFGYDPVFFVPGFGRTLAELRPEVKNRISHRAQAATRAKGLLAQMLQS